MWKDVEKRKLEVEREKREKVGEEEKNKIEEGIQQGNKYNGKESETFEWWSCPTFGNSKKKWGEKNCIWRQKRSEEWMNRKSSRMYQEYVTGNTHTSQYKWCDSHLRNGKERKRREKEEWERLKVKGKNEEENVVEEGGKKESLRRRKESDLNDNYTHEWSFNTQSDMNVISWEMSWNGNINELEGRMCWKRDRKKWNEKLREKW